MKTIVPSPKSQLEAFFGHRPQARRSLRVDTWIGFDCGDKVYRTEDPRHIGRVEAIISGVNAKIRWDETGWMEYVELAEMEKVRPEPEYVDLTFVESTG